MTFIICDSIKQKLVDFEFNCDFVMLTKVIILLQLVDDAKFMRLIKKYYILQYVNFKSMIEYLNHIKQLKN